MRIIKYRGKIDGEWRHSWPDYDEETHKDAAYVTWKLFWDHVDPETVGQFIGVSDARNEEICEGDVVRYDGMLQEPIGVIERFYAKWIIKGGAIINLTTEHSLIEVVGNIHDHPELTANLASARSRQKQAINEIAQLSQDLGMYE